MNGLLPLLDHPLAHRLGWVLLHSVWEGAIVAAVFAVAHVALRRRSANARYVAACTALLAIITAPIVTVIWLPNASFKARAPGSLFHETVVGKTYTVIRAMDHSSLGTSSYLQDGARLLDGCLPYTVPLWFIGVLGLSCRWLHGSRWIQHIRTSEIETLGLEWLLLLRGLCQRLDIERPVRLVKSALVEVPVVVGWLRPVILLPASALSGLTSDQLEAILVHELAHVRRCDYLVNTFQNLVETLMFYHPAVWWISACIREEREHCCDDLVLRFYGNRLAYVRALVTLEEARGFPRLAFAASGGSLLHRVRRLLGASNESCPPSAAEFSGITLVALGCVFILASIWLLNWPAVYQTSALIRVTPSAPLQMAAANAGYPYLLQTECLVIRSPAILGLAVKSLGSKENGPEQALDRTAVNRLRAHLNLVPVPSTSVIAIQATDSDPAEAARIANTVAKAYKEYRLDQRRKSFGSSLDSLENHFSLYEQKVRQAQQLVDRLRVELKIPDAVVTEGMPTVLLSAETLRHIEALRIESESDYVKQKTLLDELAKVDAADLPATIQGIGVQDNELSALSESLALVDQRLVSLQKELGPEHTEFRKATAQQEDLKQKIKIRTTGILMGLRAKCESTSEGLLALSNAVLNAQTCDSETAKRYSPYFEANRDLEELVRFRQILQTKIAMEKTDMSLPENPVEIVEEAVPPIQSASPNRARAFALLATGFVLAIIGWLLAKTGRPETMLAGTA